MTLIAWVLGVLLLVPVATWTVEVLIGALLKGGQPARSRRASLSIDATRSHRVAILMPAHNEESGLRASLEGVRAQLKEGDRIVLVADNCTDATAEIGEAFGCEVIRRSDPVHRGKGYALAAGIEHLAASPPDIAIVVDADALLAPGCLDVLVRTAAVRQRPVQADYTMIVSPGADLGRCLSSFAFLVRNRVRPRGLGRLGGPCHLAGCGMAFPWAALAAAPRTFGHLAEDLVMGVDLSLAGAPPLYCGEARVESLAAPTSTSEDTQRRRWEQGHVAVIRTHLPRVLGAALRRRSGTLVLLALDLAVPPLSGLVMALGATAVLAAGLAMLGGSLGPIFLAGSEVGALALGLTVAWVLEGRQVLPARGFFAMPGYVLRRSVRLLLSRIGGAGKAEWKRTDRS